MKKLKQIIEKYVLKLVVNKATKKIAEFLNGKKTYTGLVTLFIWLLIYGAPALFPDAGAIVEAGKYLQTALLDADVHLDTELLAGGAALTLIGFVHKVKKLFADLKAEAAALEELEAPPESE